MPRPTNDLEFYGMGGGCLVERRLSFHPAPRPQRDAAGWLAGQSSSFFVNRVKFDLATSQRDPYVRLILCGVVFPPPLLPAAVRNATESPRSSA
jgi:hypothetical protein